MDVIVILGTVLTLFFFAKKYTSTVNQQQKGIKLGPIIFLFFIIF